MRRTYIYDQPGWPQFTWSDAAIADLLASVRHRQGLLLGRMSALGFALQEQAALTALTADVVKTSEIEGERLDAEQVRSSIARRLGIDIGGLKPTDRDVEGMVELMLDATRQFTEPLTTERLFSWHGAMFPTARSGLRSIRVGAWRNDAHGPMQVVSGPHGREKVHFEAPPAARLDREVDLFLTWFENPPDMDGVLRAAVAHLWFVTLHPFDDGNGRIARAIADMALARSEHSPQRFYSMSTQIRQERSAYYEVLERTQKDGLDVTGWMEWFLACLGRAIDGASVLLEGVLQKADVWRRLEGVPLNERQVAVLNRLLDGFEGKLTSSKWAKLTGVSSDTALRDIQGLIDRGVLVRNPGLGRGISYSLVRAVR